VAPTSAIASAVVRPIPAHAAVINTTLPCKINIRLSRVADECGKDFPCIVKISPEEVFDAVMKLLQS
jgi:hypothetical protein